MFYSIIFGLQIHLERLVAVAYELPIGIELGRLNGRAPALVLPLFAFIVQSPFLPWVLETENISLVALHDDIPIESDAAVILARTL